MAAGDNEYTGLGKVTFDEVDTTTLKKNGSAITASPSQINAAAGTPVQTAISGGSAGSHTVSGIETGDTLVSVIQVDYTTPSLDDLTSEFSIDSADTIDNSGGTDTSGEFLLVTYIDKT